MSTGAVLAIWHDIVPEADAEVQHWYDRQHHPERLSVPGFLWARRHRAVAGGPTTFIVYDVESTQVLRSDAYLARVNNPTEWTRRCMPRFRNNSRTACRVVQSEGRGVGASVATLRITPREREERMLADYVRIMITEFMERRGAVSAQYWLADHDATTIHSNERVLRGAPDIVAPSVLVLTGSNQAMISEAGDRLRQAAALPAHGAESIEFGLYALQFSMGAGI